eukprot:Ihof_evm6s196 gene=Ihof_evmTU6s196
MAKHIIVIGGGLAGLSATLEATAKGAKVTLVEKEKATGGNSAKATSGISASYTSHQKEQGISDSVEQFQDDSLKSGQGLSKKDLVDVLVGHSKEAIDWVSSFGLDLSCISQCGGHSAPRTHREPARLDGKPCPVGWDIVSTLRARVEILSNEGLVTVMTLTRCVDILTLTIDGKEVVVGVKLQKEEEDPIELLADAVILATGGFACDFTPTSLLKQHVPHLCNLPTTNGVQTVGDGVKMGLRIGCHTVDMDQVQVHPTSFVDPKAPCSHVNFLAPEALRGCGGIMINRKGVRFFNELARRDDLTAAINQHCDKLPSHEGEAMCPTVAYMLMNQAACEKFGLPNLGFYKFKGFVKEYENATAVAKEIGCDVTTLETTLKEYGQGKDAFGKTVFPVQFTPDEPLWMAMLTPALHYCMGGLEINTSAQVLRKVGESTEPITNLYGAGEVTGGVHGKNRLAGNSLLECV